jgi:hypothetical protein
MGIENIVLVAELVALQLMPEDADRDIVSVSRPNVRFLNEEEAVERPDEGK